VLLLEHHRSERNSKEKFEALTVELTNLSKFRRSEEKKQAGRTSKRTLYLVFAFYNNLFFLSSFLRIL
jgi:hypothetical protein